MLKEMGRTTPFMDNRKNGDEAFGSPRTVIRLSRYGRKARRFYDRGRLSRLNWESGSRSRCTGFDLQCIYLSYHWAALSETIMKLKQNFIEKSSKKTITIRSQCWCLYSTKGSTGERKVLCMIFHIFSQLKYSYIVHISKYWTQSNLCKPMRTCLRIKGTLSPNQLDVGYNMSDSKNSTDDFVPGSSVAKSDERW